MAKINKLKLEVWSNENTSIGGHSLVAQRFRPMLQCKARGFHPCLRRGTEILQAVRAVAINK